MPDISDQQADLFVVEPVERLDRSPVSQSERLHAGWRGRLGLPGLLALSVLVLLVEGGFYLQVFWLKPVLFGGPGGGDWIGIVWGFWAAVAVNVAAVAGSVYLLRLSRSVT